ncbi:MAG: HEAT repeat protein [Kiritimatiellia bacterium]|jgi:HEAT repeat protein
MSALDEVWEALAGGSAPPPSNPHVLKMVLIRIRTTAGSADLADRRAALRVVRLIDSEDSYRMAVEYAKDSNDDMRRDLLQLACDVDRLGIPILRKLTHDDDEHIATRALQRLSDMSDKSSTSRVRGLLSSPHPSVRRGAAVFLGTFGGPSLVPFLRRQANDPDQSVRDAVGWAMDNLDGRSKAPPPATVAPTASSIVEAASQGVAQATASSTTATPEDSTPAPEAPTPAPEAPTPAPEAPRPAPPVAAPTPKAAPQPAPTQRSTTPRAPAKNLPAHTPREVDGSVLGVMRQIAVQPDDRKALVERLRAADDRELSAAFRGRKPGVHPDLNIGAALAAADLGNPRWLSPIRKLATDPAPRVRSAVVEALGALCTFATLRNLEAMVKDSNTEVHTAALLALVVGSRRLGSNAQARRLIDGLPESKDEAIKTARADALAALSE